MDTDTASTVAHCDRLITDQWRNLRRYNTPSWQRAADDARTIIDLLLDRRLELTGARTT